MPFRLTGEFTKTDEERRIAFGWASVVTKADGTVVVDTQDEVLDLETLELCAYDYVLHHRDGSDLHVRNGVAKCIESFFCTPEKLEKMSLKVEGGAPTGWWVGFYVDDDEVWKAVKDGRYRMFSIEGIGTREDLEEADDAA
jgi:hypothetical protein